MRAAFVLLLVACSAPGARSSGDVCVTRDAGGVALRYLACGSPAETCETDAVCNNRCSDGGFDCCYPDVARHPVDDRCHRPCADDADCGPGERCRNVGTTGGEGDAFFVAQLCTP